MHFRRGALLPSALALFALSAEVEIIDVVSVTPVRAASCPVNTTSGDGDTFNVQITGLDLSCPTTFSMSGITHYLLSTGSGKNPYTVTLSSCSGSRCPPTNIKVLGWDTVGDRCGGSKPACAALPGPWTFPVDATAQAGKACDTAPVKIRGNPGQPVLILEAGVGADCTSVSTVPEFPLGLFALFAFALPAVLLVRGRYFSKLAS